MDNLELLFSYQACDLFYNTELKAAQTSWKGPNAEGEDLHIILNTLIEVMKQKNTGIVIADARLMQVINREDQEWISDDWYPRALAAGFSFEALVVTDYTFNAVTIKKIVRTYDAMKLKTGYFKTLLSAYKWVQSGFPD